MVLRILLFSITFLACFGTIAHAVQRSAEFYTHEHQSGEFRFYEEQRRIIDQIASQSDRDIEDCYVKLFSDKTKKEVARREAFAKRAYYKHLQKRFKTALAEEEQHQQEEYIQTIQNQPTTEIRSWSWLIRTLFLTFETIAEIQAPDGI